MNNEGLLRAKKTGEVYMYHGEGKYSNLTRGGTGKLKDEDARKVFNIPVCLNLMSQQNQSLIDLITTLRLSIEQESNPDNIIPSPAQKDGLKSALK